MKGHNMPAQGEASPIKGKKLGPKPVLVIFRGVGQDGKPVLKNDIEVVAVTRDVILALDIMESGEHDGAVYKRVDGVT
jgi:hypothetical protein